MAFFLGILQLGQLDHKKECINGFNSSYMRFSQELVKLLMIHVHTIA